MVEEKVNMLGKGNTLKVVEMGLENRVFNAMKQDKFSVEALTRELNSEGITITAQSIRKFIKKSKEAQRQFIAKDIKSAEQFKQLTINYTNELKSILDEVKEVKNTVKSEKDFSTYNQMVGRIMQGIELLAKISGDMNPKTTIDINVVYKEINDNIEKEMKKINIDHLKSASEVIDAEIFNEDISLATQLRQ